MTSIHLHKEHGLNPTVTQCFFCGKDKNEIALLGAAYKGEAPRHMCINKEPCDECKSYMAMGVMLISVQDNTDPENPYKTGHIAVIKQEAAQRMFPNIGENRIAFVEDSVWEKLGLPEGNVDNREKS